MTILAVDGDVKYLEKIREAITGIEPDAEILCCTDSPQALAEARKKEIDTAFLNPEMEEISGLDLGQYLKELYPLVNLIYFTDHREYGFDAISQHASGFILNPVCEENVRRELGDLRHPALEKDHKRVFAQTFGDFELFVDGKPVEFKYSRTKEVVAVLVSRRGAQVTNGEIIASLWEDDGDPVKKASYLRNLRQDLQNTMTRLKLTGIILKQRGSMAIATDAIECDLYDWLEKKKESRYSYLGDYMNQYSWAEFVHAELDEISYAMEDE